MFVATAFDLSPRVTTAFPSMSFERFDSANPTNDAATLRVLARAEVLYVAQGFLTASNLELLPNLKWAQVPSAGYERADLSALSRMAAVLTNGRDVYSIPIAEDVLCKMVCLARHYRATMGNQERHAWREVPRMLELHGKTLGVVGTGSIAREVAVRARAFGMRVVGCNRSGSMQEGFDAVASGAQGLAQVAGEADFLVVTVPLNPHTDGLISRDTLRAMKPTAYIVNIARGRVIDEQELMVALKDGTVAGAALDVFETEPLPADSPLWGMSNVVITPHTAGNGDGVLGRLEHLLVTNLSAYPNVSSMTNVVPLTSRA